MIKNDLLDAMIHLFPNEKCDIESFVDYWIKHNVPLWAIMLAYGETVKRCDRVSILYMSAIIDNWIKKVND